MVRLIDADALKDSLLESEEQLWEIYNGLKNHTYKQIYSGQITAFSEAILRIKDASTIDAVPVVHGRWVFVEVPDLSWYGHKPGWYCSQCGWFIEDKSRKPKTPPLRFCSGCGAKMGGERKTKCD